MATYAIGDIHGCFDELQLLLEKISFDLTKDVLWFTGDLVNRGNKSIETLQFIKNLGKSAICVLGNHDLILLGMAAGKIQFPKTNSLAFELILKHPQKDELLAWLQTCPLLHYDPTFNTILVHAGLAPQWSLAQALALTKELAVVLQDQQQATMFFANMLGNAPAIWHDELRSWARLRCITNYLTRLRFCDQAGQMYFLEKSSTHKEPANMMPWYKVPNRLTKDITIIFGHWAALGGATNGHNVIALDTGCVWGNCLSAIRLEDRVMFSVKRLVH